MKKFNPGKPFNDLPLLPPKADVETKVVLRKTISAGRALPGTQEATGSLHESLYNDCTDHQEESARHPQYTGRHHFQQRNG